MIKKNIHSDYLQKNYFITLKVIVNYLFKKNLWQTALKNFIV